MIRRRILAAALALPARALAQTCGLVTPRETEGPFFKPSSPQRIALVESRGPRLTLTGQVLGRDCKPIKGALLDFWHADEHGEYDNRGFRYRGHQFADADGGWRLETIVPAVYPGRTRHIHVKVQPPGGRVLTTQLYFPGESANARDGLFREDLTMRMANAGEGSFDFIGAA